MTWRLKEEALQIRCQKGLSLAERVLEMSQEPEAQVLRFPSLEEEAAETEKSAEIAELCPAEQAQPGKQILGIQMVSLSYPKLTSSAQWLHSGLPCNEILSQFPISLCTLLGNYRG